MLDSPPFQEFFALGLATASVSLSENTGGRLTLRSFRVRSAADFPDVTEADHLDVAAGVAQRFSGALRGTAVLTMEPEGAFAWSRSVLGSQDGSGSDLDRVIPTFVELGSGLVDNLVAQVAQAMHGRPVELDAGSLCESSRVAIVIGTHPPGDTAVVTLGFDVEFGGAAHAAHMDLLLEPKSLPGDWAGSERA